MGCRVIETDGRVWVAGLNWLTFAARPPTKDLLDLAQTSGAGLIALRSAGAFQAGFCELDKLPKLKGKPTLCLGPAMAVSRPVPWRGIFDLGDGQWWYIAARDNFMITIDGDVVGSRERIDSIAQSHAFYDDWDEVEGTIEDALQMAASPDAPQVSLARAKPGPARTIGVAALATIGLAAAAYAGFLYSQHVRLEQALDAAKVAKARQVIDGQAPKPVPAPPPDQVLDAQHFLQVCGQQMLRTPSVDHGWELVSMTCNPGSLRLTWKKHVGADEAFQAQEPGSVFNAETQTLDVPKTLDNTRQSELAAQPGRAQTQSQVLFTRFTHMGLFPKGPNNHYQLAWQAGASADEKHSSAQTVQSDLGSNLPEASTPGKATPGVPLSMAPTVAFSVSGPVPPATAQQLFAGIEGLVLRRVTWTEQTGWTYAGTLR